MPPLAHGSLTSGTLVISVQERNFFGNGGLPSQLHAKYPLLVVAWPVIYSRLIDFFSVLHSTKTQSEAEQGCRGLCRMRVGKRIMLLDWAL